MGALDGHRLQQIPQWHRLARIGRNIVKEPRDKSTERFVDARCLLTDPRLVTGRRRPGSGFGDLRERPPAARFRHGYSVGKPAILMIATISLSVKLRPMLTLGLPATYNTLWISGFMTSVPWGAKEQANAAVLFNRREGAQRASPHPGGA
jgi:hypothetical protein